MHIKYHAAGITYMPYIAIATVRYICVVNKYTIVIRVIEHSDQRIGGAELLKMWSGKDMLRALAQLGIFADQRFYWLSGSLSHDTLSLRMHACSLYYQCNTGVLVHSQ